MRSMLRRQVQLSPLAWGLLALVFLLAGSLPGALSGSLLARRPNPGQQAAALEAQIESQYTLGLEEMEAGDYDRAAQRFRWILVQDPDHQGAIDQLALALVHVYVDEEQVPDPLEPTPTAAIEYQPDEAAGLVDQAQREMDQRDWRAALESLAGARQADPNYETARIDRLLFVTLRQRGIELILQVSDLAGGLYHLSLTEQFAPLDVEAESVRSWARLYLVGASFWGVMPDQAAYYFGQLADAAPYLSDLSGIPAVERYFQALVQYGDQLAEAGDWCAAADQYGLALGRRYDADLEARAADAQESCENPKEDESPNPESTPTPTPTITTTINITPTVSETVFPTETPTLPSETVTPEITPTPEDTAAPEPTGEPTGEPTPTPGG